MNKWMYLVEEFGLGDFSQSVISVYNLYRKEEGFSDQLFYHAMKRAVSFYEDETLFFEVLINEIVTLLQLTSTYRFLAPTSKLA